MADPDLASRIRVKSVENVVVGREANFKIVISYEPRFEGDVALSYTTYIRQKDFDEENIIKAARCFFHNMCRITAESTESWSLTDEQFEGLKKPIESTDKMQP